MGKFTADVASLQIIKECAEKGNIRTRVLTQNVLETIKDINQIGDVLERNLDLMESCVGLATRHFITGNVDY